MGTLGVQEMVVIFILALVLFGPEKLPELGRTIGKALTEFRRHSNDLKATFEREMHTLEREADSFRQDTQSIAGDLYKHANFELPAPESIWNPEEHESATLPTTQPTIVGASAIPGAESNGTTETAVSAPPDQTPAIEGTVPRAGTANHQDGSSDV